MTDHVTTEEKGPDTGVKASDAQVVVVSSEASADGGSNSGQVSLVPLRMKLISILLVTAVGFGSHWSSGVTGAMKSTLKKVSGHSCIDKDQDETNGNQRSNCTSTMHSMLCWKRARTL